MFAQKGYLSIVEYEPKRYRIIKGKRPVGEEKMYRNAYSILFEDVYKGRAVDMDKIPARLERIRASIENDVAAGFTSNDDSPFTPISRTFRYVGAAVLGAGLACRIVDTFLNTPFSEGERHKGRIAMIDAPDEA